MNEKKIKSVRIRYDWRDVFEEFTYAQAGLLMRHVIDYAEKRVDGVIDDELVELAFIGMKPELDYDIEDFEKTKKGRSLAGKKSAEKRRLERNKAEQKSTKATNSTDSDTESVPESVPESNAEIESEFEGTHSQSFGTYGQVRLTKVEVLELKAEMGPEFEAKVNYLSDYMEINGKSYANHAAILHKWYREDRAKNQLKCSIPNGLEQEAIRKTIEQFGAAGSLHEEI